MKVVATKVIPDNLDALTPTHFLIGRKLLAVPKEPMDLDKCVKTRWLMIQQRCQHLWKPWINEYLHLLQQRFKWKDKLNDVKPGQLVLIQDINTTPLSYPLGQVVEVIKSKDVTCRHVRSAKVKEVVNAKESGLNKEKIKTRIYVLPIVKLIPLVDDTK